MKIQIDTTAKTIKIEESVNLGELFEKLETLLPNEWKEYSIEVSKIQNWSNPIVINPHIPPYQPYWQQLPITYTSHTTTPNKYNVEF